jgi:hypothetical protein
MKRIIKYEELWENKKKFPIIITIMHFGKNNEGFIRK